jgi:hypothetical protein
MALQMQKPLSGDVADLVPFDRSEDVDPLPQLGKAVDAGAIVEMDANALVPARAIGFEKGVGVSHAPASGLVAMREHGIAAIACRH